MWHIDVARNIVEFIVSFMTHIYKHCYLLVQIKIYL